MPPRLSLRQAHDPCQLPFIRLQFDLHIFLGKTLQGGFEINTNIDCTVFCVCFGAVHYFPQVSNSFANPWWVTGPCCTRGPPLPGADSLLPASPPSFRLADSGGRSAAELPGTRPCPPELSALPGNMPLHSPKSDFPPTHLQGCPRRVGQFPLPSLQAMAAPCPAPRCLVSIHFTQMTGLFPRRLKITPATHSSLKLFLNRLCPQSHFSQAFH